MKFDEYLHKLSESAEPNEKRQIAYVLSQLENDNTEPCVSDEEESAEESEDNISYYAEETDNAPYRGKSMLIAGEELLAEFIISRDNIFQQSKISSRKLSEGEDNSQEENKDRPTTPVHGFTKAPIDPRIPSGMRAKPKIPRTPIPQEKLEEIKKADEEFFKKAIIVPSNKPKVKKIGKVVHVEQPISEAKKEVPHKITDDVKANIPEEKKLPKETKKEPYYASVKRDQLASVIPLTQTRNV